MEKLVTIFKIPELRWKIFITLCFLIVYRAGFNIPLPMVDQSRLENFQKSQRGGLLGYITMFSASDISMSTIFGLGIMPYISASIIFQLLASVVPSLEKLMKEGQTGQRKINEYTRYATVFLCLGQSIFWYRYISRPGGMELVPLEYTGFGYTLVAVLTMTAGSVFLMWVGEQIDEYGIGNGISLLIMCGIIARMPNAGLRLLNDTTREIVPTGNKPYGLSTLIILLVLFVAVVVGVVAITQSMRRIPTQSAKHVRGRRVFGGTRQFLPLRVNQAGVMPIIFAGSLLMFPTLLLNYARQGVDWPWLSDLADSFTRYGYIYNIAYIALIYFFCYFWTAITFNPKDMADNLKDYGSFIPGYRPGKRTADYLERVMIRITYVGAAFLAIVAIVPSLVSTTMHVDPYIASFYGGTGLLIVVSVALDLVQKIDSHLIMRNYTGLLEK